MEPVETMRRKILTLEEMRTRSLAIDGASRATIIKQAYDDNADGVLNSNHHHHHHYHHSNTHRHRQLLITFESKQN